MSGPQYAITHTRSVEYIVVTRGTGILVTGGTLIPPTIDTDPYPNSDPNATIRSAVGVAGGLSRRIGPGDVIVDIDACSGPARGRRSASPPEAHGAPVLHSARAAQRCVSARRAAPWSDEALRTGA